MSEGGEVVEGVGTLQGLGTGASEGTVAPGTTGGGIGGRSRPPGDRRTGEPPWLPPSAVLPRHRPPMPNPLAGLVRTVSELGAMVATALESLRLGLRHGIPVGELIDQCWFLVRVTTLPLILVSIPFGMVIALEVGSLLQQIGAQSQLGAAMVLAVVREQAPVATALLIAGAGGSAMCADLGSRRIRDEISAMEVMGVQPLQRLVLPRLVAATVVAVLLDSIVSVAGIAGGLYFGTHSLHISASAFFATFGELSQLADIWVALFKAGVFGFIAAMVACYKGMSCKGGPKGVGDAVNQAVVATFILAFFVNFVLTIMYFKFIPQKGL